MNWVWKNFTPKEMRCQHCGADGIKPELMNALQKLREVYGKPMRVTSGYRCPQHPIEAKKASPGAHASGLAVDIGVEGAEAYQVMKLAFELGFTGIGVNQKGTGRFIHLDVAGAPFPRPTVWSY